MGKIRKLAAAVAVSGVIVACGSDNKHKVNDVTEQDVKSTHAKMAYRAYSDSLTTGLALQVAITAFLAEPTEANLAEAKVAYKAARAPYQESEIMRWDTDITQSTSTGDDGVASVDEWEGQVNAWPLDEDYIDYTLDNMGMVKAGKIVGGDQPITKAALIALTGADDNEANVTTGVHAIEFLLWGQDLNGVDAGAGERPASDYAIDAADCTNGNCDRRREYLKVATELLIDDLTAMQAEWSVDARQMPGTLGYNLLNSDTALDYILLSLYNMSVEELAGARIHTAVKELVTEEEHDCFSDMTHVAIYHNFQGIKNAFYGRYMGTDLGAGIADLVRQRNGEALLTQFDVVFSDIETDMKALYDLGERTENPVRFDQIIGLGINDPENEHFKLLAALPAKIVTLGSMFQDVAAQLSLPEISTEGGGDGD